jgi:hypothetical protein
MEPTRDGVLDFLADRAMGILVLLFVVSYALIRPAYERFYEPMGCDRRISVSIKSR